MKINFRYLLAYLGAVVLVTGLAFWLLLQQAGPPLQETTTGPCLEINGQKIFVEIADEPAERQLGLGYRDSLPAGHGMLFVFDRPGRYGFWMKGMRFALDYVFICDGVVVDVQTNVPAPAGDELPVIVRAAADFDQVLEVSAGFINPEGLVGRDLRYFLDF